MKLTNTILLRAHKIAVKKSAMSEILEEAFLERYGIYYGDERITFHDSIIDCLDYGTGGMMSLSEIDKIMAQAGFPPLTAAGRAALAQGGGE